MKKSKWFASSSHPQRPGIYLCRAVNMKLQWWRCFDGGRWRAGIMATNPQGELVNVAPSFESQVNNSIVADYVYFDWCGVSK